MNLAKTRFQPSFFSQVVIPFPNSRQLFPHARNKMKIKIKKLKLKSVNIMKLKIKRNLNHIAKKKINHIQENKLIN